MVGYFYIASHQINFVWDVIERIRQYCDELLYACTEFVLSDDHKLAL